MTNQLHMVVLFDGPCTLCNKAVQWIDKHDTNNRFLFASLQSDWATTHLPDRLSDMDSVILQTPNEWLSSSDAILEICNGLPNFKWLTGLKAIPRPIREFIYRRIARNRFTIFGKGYCAIISSDKILN